MRKKTRSKTRITTYAIILWLLAIGTSIGQTVLKGKVVDASIKDEVIIFGTVALYENGILIAGTETDLKGDYIFNNLDPGVYTVEASYIGYRATRVIDVVIKEGHIVQLDLAIKEGIRTCCGLVTPYEIPLIDFFNTSSGKTFTSREIRSMVR